MKDKEELSKNPKITKAILTKNFLLPIVGAFVSQFPQFMPHWLLAQGFFGTLFDLQQEKINEFVEFLKNNSSSFTQEIIETQEFKDGFLITFQEFIKQRNKEKRKHIQSIFLGFTASSDKVNFEMERMYDLLNKISGFQSYILKKVCKEQKIIITSESRNTVESDYDDIKYLQSLGLLSVIVEHKIETEVTIEKPAYNYKRTSGPEYVSDASSFLDEKETFSLSVFGEDFIKFIVNE